MFSLAKLAIKIEFMLTDYFCACQAYTLNGIM